MILYEMITKKELELWGKRKQMKKDMCHNILKCVGLPDPPQ